MSVQKNYVNLLIINNQIIKFMALPKQKRSKTRIKNRQYALRLKKRNLSKCPKCNKATIPHHVCLFCGTYMNKEIIKLKADKTKKGKDKEKEEKNKK